MSTYQFIEERGALTAEIGWRLPFIPVMVKCNDMIVLDKNGEPLIIRREFRFS